MTYDSGGDRVKVQRSNSVRKNIEIVIGESRRIWMTPEEAKHVLEGLKRMLADQ